jgi:uncharacterized protein DUF6916
MKQRLEQEDFAKNLNSTFKIRISESETVDCQLHEVTELLLSPRQERFAVVFRTSNDFYLDQGMRSFEHDVMGQFELFLVPVGRDEDGTYYEACFNRLVKKPQSPNP